MMTKNRKKIVVCDLITSCGGVQQVMANVLPKLAEKFDIAVVDPYVNKDYAEKFRGSGVKMYFTKTVFKRPYIGGEGTWKRLLNLILAIPRLFKIRYMFAKAISEIKPDFIYSNQLNTVRILATIRQIREIPLIYHAHGYIGRAILNDASVKVMNSRVSKVIPVSNCTARQLYEAGVRPDIVHLCHNAVKIDEIERISEQPVNKALPVKRPGQVIFVLPAVIQRPKGQHLAIQALSVLIKKGCNVGLWLAGDVRAGGIQAYLQELRTMAKDLDVSNFVHFLGWRDDIYQVIKAADVVMLCSLEIESFGLVLAEAMVLSKSCIGARTGGIPEIISENQTGLLFMPGSYQSLAEAMTMLASSKEMRESFGKAGRKRVEDLFGINIQADRINEILTMTPA